MPDVVRTVDGVVRTVDGVVRTGCCCGGTPPDPTLTYLRARLCPGGPCSPPLGEPEIYIPDSVLCNNGPMPVGAVIIFAGLCWRLDNALTDPRYKVCPEPGPGPGQLCLPPGAMVVLGSQITGCYNDCGSAPCPTTYYFASPCKCDSVQSGDCVVVPCATLLEAMATHGACVVFRRPADGSCWHVSLFSPWTYSPAPTCDIVTVGFNKYQAGKCCECCAGQVGSKCCYLADKRDAVTGAPPLCPELGPGWDLVCCHRKDMPVRRSINYRRVVDHELPGLPGGAERFHVLEGQGVVEAEGEIIQFRDWRGPDLEHLTLVATYDWLNPGPCTIPSLLRSTFVAESEPYIGCESSGSVENFGTVTASCGSYRSLSGFYATGFGGVQVGPKLEYDVEILQTTTRGTCGQDCTGAGGTTPIVPPGGGEGGQLPGLVPIEPGGATMAMGM